MINSGSASALPHGYRWLVVVDPTGIFEGGIFQTIDLVDPWESGFVDGTTFQHIEKPIRKVVKNGRIITQQITSPNVGGVSYLTRQAG